MSHPPFRNVNVTAKFIVVSSSNLTATSHVPAEALICAPPHSYVCGQVVSKSTMHRFWTVMVNWGGPPQSQTLHPATPSKSETPEASAPSKRTPQA